MIFYNRYDSFNKKMSSASLKDWIEENSTRTTFNLHTSVNTFLNVMTPLCLLLFFNFNLLKMAIAFILFDVLMVFANYFFFYFIPYQTTKRLSLGGVQKRIDKMYNRIKYLEQKREKCDYYSNAHYHYGQDIIKLKEFIDVEERYLQTEQKKIEKEQVEKDVRVSKDFENKQEYFLKCSEKLRYYIEEQKMDVLTPVLRSVLKLKNILKKKPSAIDIVPNTLYIYLDEILNVANSLMNLDNEHREKYKENVEKVSIGIQTTIMNLVERIHKMETNDIEVSLNVLMQELGKENLQNEDTNATLIISRDDITVTKKHKHNLKQHKGEKKKDV